MNGYDWSAEFRKVYEAGCARYEKGERAPDRLFSKDEAEFLARNGCSTQELFDFIDDKYRYDGDPSYEAALICASIRRDYFLVVQNGIPSRRKIDMDDLPAKTAEVDGIEWLPRLIEKARAKLRGEMPPDLMYGCGGDRPFLRSVNIDLGEFLQLAWRAGDDKRMIVEYVKRRRGQTTK